MKERPSAVICLWEVDETLLTRDKDGFFPDSFGKLWKLVETYGVDSDGYAATPSKHASNDRHSYQPWLSRKCWYDRTANKVVYECPPTQDVHDCDWENIPGRVVTGWTMESGVFLAGFNPPGGHHRWLGLDFFKVLKQSELWTSFITDGHTLFLGTARAAEKTMFKPKKSK